MTATDELRRMLDERGVDHEDYEGAVVRTTSWTANDGQSVTFMDRLDNGKTMFGFDTSAFTPEEAVAATLGAGTCKRVFYEPTGVYVCSECGLGLSKKLDKYCFLRFCPNCGRKVVES